MSNVAPRLAILLILISAAGASAQTGRVRSAATLAGALPNVSQLADVLSATEFTIRWVVADSATGDPIPASDVRAVNQFELLSQRAAPAGPVRERAPQLSANAIVVVTVDASGRELWWQQVHDPRIVRAELPNATGELSGQILFRPVAELLLTIPDGQAIAALRVFDVQAGSAGLTLHELGEIAVGAR